MSGDEHKPKPKLRADLELMSLSLSAEEGYMVSRIDGMTSARDLSRLTGLSDARVSEILGRLWRLGALEPEMRLPKASVAAKQPPSFPEAAVHGRRPGPEPAAELETDPEPVEAPLVEETKIDRSGADRSAVEEPKLDRWEAEPSVVEEPKLDRSEVDRPASAKQEPDRSEAEPSVVEEPEESEDFSSDTEEPGTAAERSASHRRLFMDRFSSLEADARVAYAKVAEGDELAALCYDPDHRVIRAVLENAKCGLEHARLIAAHHRTGTGLGHLGQKAALIRDRQTQRLLFRNPQLPDLLFEKILAPRRMVDAYRLALSRDITERVKSNARRSFRKKFADGTAEERVSLIFSTEGRCLPMLIGVPLDGRSASLLAGRPIHSTLLVQNLARWPATPPVVLVHLAKQPMVRRTPSLSEMLRRHPNAPSNLKRG